jgi:VCBS repeat-containing protein
VPGKAYVISAADMAGADAADGTVDGKIYVDNIADQPSSFELNSGGSEDRLGTLVASAGDVDGDVIIAAPLADGATQRSGVVYLMTAAGLSAADAADGTTDGVIQFLDSPAIARDDAFATDETAVLTGLNVFADNGFGPDTDSDSPLNLTRLDGRLFTFKGASVESLGSGGPLLKVNAQNSFDYDPNGKFEYLPAGATLVDTFSYELNADSTATVTITITGVDNDDLFVGTASEDLFEGGIGDDRLLGYLGNDTMAGGTGNDTVVGHAGDDTLAGDGGMDTVYGGEGNDWIDGGAEADRIVGARGDDMVWGAMAVTLSKALTGMTPSTAAFNPTGFMAAKVRTYLFFPPMQSAPGTANGSLIGRRRIVLIYRALISLGPAKPLPMRLRT